MDALSHKPPRLVKYVYSISPFHISCAGKLDTVYKLEEAGFVSCIQLEAASWKAALTPRDFNQEIFRRNNVRKLLPENYPHQNLAREKLRYPAHNQELR